MSFGWKWVFVRAGLVGALVVPCACSSAEAGSPGLSDNSGADFGGASGAGDTNNPVIGAAGQAQEQELEDSFLAPAVTGKRIWSANPESGRVALVDAETLEVSMTNAGRAPTFIAAIPKLQAADDAALVLNVKGSNASHLQASSQGTITATTIATHSGANSWALSADGKWAIAWTDYRKIKTVDVTDSFQDITVIELDNDAPTRLTVGYRPVQVHFDVAAQHAYVVAEPGISVIDLDSSGPKISQLIDVSSDAIPASDPKEVDITPDAKYAFVRSAAGTAVDIIDLATLGHTSVPLGGSVTDLDVSQDGKTAVAVVRSSGTEVPEPPSVIDAGVVDASGPDAAMNPNDASPADAMSSDGASPADAVADGGDDASGPAPPPEDASTQPSGPASWLEVFHLADSISSPETIAIPGETFGSVSLSPTANVATLYTNATGSDRLTVVDLASHGHRTVSLKSPILSVLVSDDGLYAIALQTAANPTAPNAKKGAFSIVPLATDRAPKIVGTDAAPVSVAIMPGTPSDRALVTVSDIATATFASYLIRLPEMSTDAVRLASEPLATGIVAEARKGFVAERHAAGRVSFIDLDSGEPRTLTGFELAAEVVQ